MFFGVVCVVVLSLLLFTLLRGAPYVPVHKRDVSSIFSLLNISPGGTMVDIGSGDGVVLKAASQRGIKAIGIEINPLLVLWSRLRLRMFKNSQVIWKDMFRWQIPSEAEAVFVFAGGPFVKKIEAWLQDQVQELGRPLKVVSYGFDFKNHTIVSKDGAALLYVFEPVKP